MKRTCEVEGCNNKHYAKGCCAKHYRQIRLYGRILERNKLDPNEIIIYDNYAEIMLYDSFGKEVGSTIIDIDDVDKVRGYKWHIGDNDYIIADVGRKKVRLNKLIMDCPEDMVVSYISSDRTDNRKANLMICTKAQVTASNPVRKDNTSGYKGVTYHKPSGKWFARIMVNGKQINLGSYKDINEAIKARKKAEKEYFNSYRNKHR